MFMSEEQPGGQRGGSDEGSAVGEKVPRRGREGGPIMRGFKAMMMRLDIILSAMELTSGQAADVTLLTFLKDRSRC